MQFQILTKKKSFLILSYAGINFDVKANSVAKAALCKPTNFCLIPYADLKPLINNHINNQ